MALSKVTYTDNVTIIYASNLNNIQDAIIALESGAAPTPYTSLPADLGVASAGSASAFARGDHVHKMPSAADVGALSSGTAIPSTAADVGAIASPASASVGDFLCYTSAGWGAVTVPAASGVSF